MMFAPPEPGSISRYPGKILQKFPQLFHGSFFRAFQEDLGHYGSRRKTAPHIVGDGALRQKKEFPVVPLTL